MQCDPRVLQQNTSQDLTYDEKHVIHTVTSKMDTLPVGTFKYKVFKYPGDIDLFEQLENCCTLSVAKGKAAIAIQDVIKKILDDPEIIITDFKAGYDDRFRIYTGIINNHAVDDYRSHMVYRDITNLYDANLLTRSEYTHLISMIPKETDLDAILKLNEELRNYWVLRWTVPEILRGYKILRGNYKLFLDWALTQGSIVKLDTIAPVDGRYVEITNFMVVKQIDKYGNVIFLTEELHDYEQSLLGDVYKYEDVKVLKAVKRLWMYLAFHNKICDLTMFTELFSSVIALFAQIQADIETALVLLESNYSYDKQLLLHSMRDRILTLSGIDCEVIDITTIGTKQHLIHYMNKLHTCLQKVINDMTIDWLHNHNISIRDLIAQFG